MKHLFFIFSLRNIEIAAEIISLLGNHTDASKLDYSAEIIRETLQTVFELTNITIDELNLFFSAGHLHATLRKVIQNSFRNKIEFLKSKKMRFWSAHGYGSVSEVIARLLEQWKTTERDRKEDKKRRKRAMTEVLGPTFHHNIYCVISR